MIVPVVNRGFADILGAHAMTPAPEREKIFSAQRSFATCALRSPLRRMWSTTPTSKPAGLTQALLSA